MQGLLDGPRLSSPARGTSCIACQMYRRPRTPAAPETLSAVVCPAVRLLRLIAARACTQTTAAALLEGLGVPKKAVPGAAPDGGAAAELRIRREIRQDGGMLRSRCFVNGAATSLRVRDCRGICNMTSSAMRLRTSRRTSQNSYNIHHPVVASKCMQVLRELAAALVDVNGQNSALSLR